ncbi:hypothetical protein Hanom_Chr04g00284211 [Helianthus anomalus]
MHEICLLQNKTSANNHLHRVISFFKNLGKFYKSKLQKSSFMYVTYCKLCSLSSIITENVLDVCKPLQVMSFSPNSINFCV